GERADGVQGTMQQRGQQGLQLQLGRKRVPQSPDGGAQPASLVLHQLQAGVSLIDALVAILRQQPQQQRQGENGQSRRGLSAGGDAGDEPQRGQARIDDPHGRDDAEL